MKFDGTELSDQLTTRERRFALLYGGVWLLFLAWPLAAIATAPGHSAAARVVGILAVIAFAATYLRFLTSPRTVASWPPVANGVLHSAVLFALMGLTAPTAGMATMGMTPFVIAVWMFTHRLRTALTASLLIAAGALAVGTLAARPEPAWGALYPVVLGTGVLAMIRIALEYHHAERELSERLSLTRQREELARAVHDALGHSLTVVSVQAQLAKRLLASDPAAAEREIDGILATSRAALGEVRSTVEFLDAPDLRSQLARTRDMLRAADIAADLPGPAELPALPPEKESLFAWCLREATTNVVRHSGAGSCRIRITGDDARATLTITDDGIGIPGGLAGDAVERGTGLRGLSSRAERAGGSLTLRDARPDQAHPGTILEVRI